MEDMTTEDLEILTGALDILKGISENNCEVNMELGPIIRANVKSILRLISLGIQTNDIENYLADLEAKYHRFNALIKQMTFQLRIIKTGEP